MGFTLTGIVWYTEIAYYILKEKFEDKAKLPDTYSEWLQSAEGLLRKLRSEGIRAIPINMEPSVFLEWCSTNGLRLDAKARTRYANEGAAKVVDRNLTSRST